MVCVATDHDSLGGKGANLVRLREAGFPVPEFIVLGTCEYREFVAANGLAAVIAERLARLRLDQRDESATPTVDVVAASEAIRAAFRRPMSTGQRERIAAAVSGLLNRPLAVRSSATAEDLPGASFAGQQDTFLDVRGLEAVLDAVVECWSSLWTARAITYRARNDVSQEAVSLAVVVQELVAAEASGVMFTADPLTGHRGHVVVDAVFGLGERLVSGQVVPDHFVVDERGTVLERDLQGERPALSNSQLDAVVRLGRQVAAHYGTPQDLEWTRVGDQIQLVQTRPITNLYPLPEPSAPDALWFSFGAFQGMLDPITPLGQDSLRSLLAGATPVFGAHVGYRTNHYLRPAGERLWIRLDDVLRTVPGHRGAPGFLAAADPNAAAVLRRFADEDAYAPARGSLRQVMHAMGPFVRRTLPRVLAALRRPRAARERLAREAEQVVTEVAGRLQFADSITTADRRLDARLGALDAFAAQAFPILLPAFAPIMAPSIALMLRLRALAARTGLPDAEALALGVLRGLPGNVTTEMDLALWDVARTIRADSASAEAFRELDAAALADGYLTGMLPLVAQEAVADFMRRYGMRGVGEIDLGAPRWGEQPEGVFRTIRAYLESGPGQAPDALYETGRRDAEATLERLAAASGPLAARQVRFAGSRLRGLFGARETPKFTLVRALGLLREGLQASGRDLVDAGVLTTADDVFYLHLDELDAVFPKAGFEHRDLRPVVAERRASHAREQRRARIPIVLVGDGRTFYDAGTPTDADLAGMGVSPGVVEDVVRVVDDPRTSELQPGEIMVCRGTDPAWTPLFLTASGLVTEVGGMVTHGSVVAREYGLPAVVGVAGATQTLRTGQRIRLDGTAGTITFVTD